MSRIAILGAGAWGTAITLALHRTGSHQLTLWAHSPQHAEQMQQHRENTRYLPGFPLDNSIAITASLHEAAAGAQIVISVTPSEHLRSTITSIAPLLTSDTLLISASKGIEEHTHLRMTQIMASLTNATLAVLGGPSFAKEVAAALPTAAVIATADNAIAQRLQSGFSSESFRIYTNNDITGVELGGALKNIIALAAGIVSGLELGNNAAAGLITRGMAEITRLAVACGARPETLAGLAGTGDLVLTCTGSLSRNRTVGVELGRGRKLPEILTSLNGKVAEGIRCTTAALGLAAQHQIEMPITEQMDLILHQNKPPREAIRELMTRPGRYE